MTTNINTIDDNYERSSTAKKEETETDDDSVVGLRKLMESFGDIFGKSDNDSMRASSALVASGLSFPNLVLKIGNPANTCQCMARASSTTACRSKFRWPIWTKANKPSRAATNDSVRSTRSDATRSAERWSPQTKSSLFPSRWSQRFAAHVASGVCVWTALAVSFANFYNERYGENFLDALFRTWMWCHGNWIGIWIHLPTPHKLRNKIITDNFFIVATSTKTPRQQQKINTPPPTNDILQLFTLIFSLLHTYYKA